jgi:CRP/FNR family transcriptional regulator, anaerobic regulatory protein
MLLSVVEAPSTSWDARELVPAVMGSRCETCKSRSINRCDALFGAGGNRTPIGAKTGSTPARQNIYRAGEAKEGVLVICDGWAVRFIQLPDGKRQILSVVLPGEVVCPTSFLERQFTFSVQAVTNVRYCYFPFAEVRARIQSDPALFDIWFRLMAAEHGNGDKRLVDLGQRTAQERIAALIVHMMVRCEQRGEFHGDTFAFPMSQQQIADFTGLTPVHACRILSSLRRKSVCNIGRGIAKIIDRGELERMGSLK